DLRELLGEVAERSFHCLSVDGDTSPNDAVLLWCAGRAKEDRDCEGALLRVSRELCRAIAADGEGATRLITIRVRGTPNPGDAARVGRTIATSPLVKTAIAGRDPNWGRIAAAAARAGCAFDPARLRIAIGGAVVYADGTPHPEREPAAHAHMASGEEVL